MIEFREGKPKAMGLYLCKVNPEPITLPVADNQLLFFQEGDWWWPRSDARYRDHVYLWAGPIQVLKLEETIQETTVHNFYHIGKKIPDGYVYIGRAGQGLKEHPLHNPFKITDKCDRDTVIRKYESYLWRGMNNGTIDPALILSLDGKKLVCYCSPHKCHGDVIVKAIEWLKTDDNYQKMKEKYDANRQR